MRIPKNNRAMQGVYLDATNSHTHTQTHTHLKCIPICSFFFLKTLFQFSSCFPQNNFTNLSQNIFIFLMIFICEFKNKIQNFKEC